MFCFTFVAVPGGRIITVSTPSAEILTTSRSEPPTQDSKLPPGPAKSADFSGWAIAGPIFLVFVLLLVGGLVYYFVLRDKTKLWLMRRRTEMPPVGVGKGINLDILKWNFIVRF